MAVVEVGRHIVIDPETVHGQMIFRDTRVPVETVLLYIAKGDSVADIVRQWPRTSSEAVQEAVRLVPRHIENGGLVRAIWIQNRRRQHPKISVTRY